MKIGKIDTNEKTFILAEIGNNHNGDFTVAKEMIKQACDAGADGIKFQTFDPDYYIHKSLPTFSHAKVSTQHQREHR